ncbi:MAG: esterase, partial [Gammaproteobacteria bacterium]|nr:esterase [Gammaproteobacteria bacterium]
VLDETGDPDEAGQDFAAARDKVVQRIATCDWKLERDDDTVFSQSPEALFYWSPIADELKQRDEMIVKNSIRFRWIEVRRSLRKLLDCKALAETLRAAEL